MWCDVVCDDVWRGEWWNGVSWCDGSVFCGMVSVVLACCLVWLILARCLARWMAAWCLLSMVGGGVGTSVVVYGDNGSVVTWSVAWCLDVSGECLCYSVCDMVSVLTTRRCVANCNALDVSITCFGISTGWGKLLLTF